MSKNLAAVAACVAVTLVLLFADIRIGSYSYERLFNRVMDAGHVPLFALLMLIYSFFDSDISNRGLLKKSAILTALAILTELGQPYFNRSASIGDVAHSVIGLGLAAAALMLYRRSAPLQYWIALLLLALVAISEALTPAFLVWRAIAWRDKYFPLLAAFESGYASGLWTAAYTGKGAGTIMKIYELDSRKVLCAWNVSGERAALLYDAGNLDWSGRHRVELEFYTNRPLTLHMRIEDAEHNGEFDDRFSRQLKLPTGWSNSTIELADIAAAPKTRRLDLTHMTKMGFYADAEDIRFCIERMELK